MKLLLLPYCSYFRRTFGKNFFSQQKPDKFSEKENYEILQTLFFLLLHLMTAKHHVQLDERTVAFNCFHLEKYKLFCGSIVSRFCVSFQNSFFFFFFGLKRSFTFFEHKPDVGCDSNEVFTRLGSCCCRCRRYCLCCSRCC